MADRPLFTLDAEKRWRLAYDQHQWIIQRRDKASKVRSAGKNGGHIRDDGFRGRSYANGRKATLWRLFRELEILLTEDAIERVDALPDSFCLFLYQHDPELARRNPVIKRAMAG